MGFGPKPPSASEINNQAQETALKQQQLSYDSAVSNNINQKNPFGSLTYETSYDEKGRPIFTANSKLSPEQQVLFDQLQGTKTQAGGIAGSLLNSAKDSLSTAPDFLSTSQGLTADWSHAYTKQMEQQFAPQREQMDAQLRAQGLNPGTPAYDQQMSKLVQAQNTNIGSMVAQFTPQAFNLAKSAWGAPVDMAENLANFGAPGQAPEGNKSAGILAPNLTTAQQVQGQNEMNQYNAEAKNLSNTINAATSIAGAVAGGPIGASIGKSLGSMFTPADNMGSFGAATPGFGGTGGGGTGGGSVADGIMTGQPSANTPQLQPQQSGSPFSYQSAYGPVYTQPTANSWSGGW